jgi:hypothetical protein
MDHGSQDWPSFAAVEVDPWRVESVLAAAGTLVSHADGAANRRRRRTLRNSGSSKCYTVKCERDGCPT